MRSSQELFFSGFSRTVLSAAVALVVAAPALAQNTTAAIGGQVTGADGKPVAGASVSIVHTESGSSNKLVTDAEGRYSARGLRVGGPYTIVVTKGSDKDTRDGVFLQLAESLALDMKLGGMALQAVVVTGTANNKFSSSAMGSGTNLGRKELDAYASMGRNLQDYARSDPRLSQTDKERGEISAGGQNSRYNSITIDGVRTNDTFGLEANNLPTTKQPISIDAIQSVQVNLSNYDVTQQGYTGANINAVTKSGTNDVKGSVYYVYRNDSMGGQRYNKTADTYTSFLPFKEDTKGFTLGGPIIQDKLFFFTSYEELKSNRAQPEFGPVGSSLSNVAISQGAIDAAKATALSRYGMDVGDISGPSALSAKDYLFKVDWNISEQHRANVRFARTEQTDTNNGSFGGYSATGLQLTSQWWDQKKKIDTVVGQWFADWTPNFSTEVKVSNRDYNSVPLNNANLPAMAFQFTGAAPAGAPAGVNTGSRFLNFGTERSRHTNVLDTKTMNAYVGGTWNLDAHELKFGADLDNNKVYNAFFQNTKGNYTFSCQNSSATYTYSFGTINCATATAAQIEAAILENFSKGRPTSYQVQIPVAGGSLDNGTAQWTLRNTGLFLQDTWTASKQLTLTAGVRLDQLGTGDRPQFNAAAAAPAVDGKVTPSGTTFAVARNTGGFGLDNSATVDGQQLFQPRVGFNYALDAENKQKSQVRGGFGLFQGAAANVWLSNPYSNTGLATRIVACGTLGFAVCPPGGGIFSADPLTQPSSFAGASPASNVDFIESGLGQPAVWKANLAIDAELPFGGLIVGAEWLGTKNKNGIYYKHLNLGGATMTGPDGRQMFYNARGYDPSCWANGSAVSTCGVGTKAMSNIAFADVLQAVKTSEGGGNAITLSLTGPRVWGMEWNVAYTRTDATEVSPLTSSVSSSNFNARSIFNPNEEVASNSAYLTKDRINASLNWSAAFDSKYKTTFGLFYEARSGKPYSWTYANDLNGDNISGNDLMYIPKGPQSGEVVFAGDTAANHPNEDRFWSIVNSNSELSDSKGGVVKRNGSYSPVVHNFDLRISQEVPGFAPKHKGVISLDIFNLGNLINKEWGRINEPLFSGGGGVRRTFVNYGGLDASGRYVYAVRTAEDDLQLRQAKGESQWAAQITARYEF